MIRQFRVQNFKALRDVTLDLTPIHVLIGPNDSGKSSILQALQSLCESMDADISQAFMDQWTGGSWVYKTPVELVYDNSVDAPISMVSRLDDEHGSMQYDLRISLAPNERKALWIQETFSTIPAMEPIVIKSSDRTCTSLCKISDKVTDFDLEDREYDFPVEPPEVIRVWEALGPADFIDLSANELVRPSECIGSPFATGYGFPSWLNTLRVEERDRFDALESRFQEIFPSVESIQILTQEESNCHEEESDPIFKVTLPPRRTLQVHFKHQSRPLAAAQLGDGMLYLLGYLALRYSPEPVGVLLIENPETGLHPEHLTVIANILREIVAEHPQTQIVITTHSPYLLDEFQPEEVSVCYRDAQGDIKVKRLDRSPLAQKHLDIFSLGEVWTGEGEQALAESVGEVRR